ncbi:FIG00883040: hypothetical protein [hydrothermal vent metagenome]|uniref:PIG-L family deacetylase n=1 Tax=hydrothermal vent metagenome TaxID=652676 RepID=A0A3B0T600_9ZZZZ
MGLSDIVRIDRQRANPRITRLWKAMRPLGSVASFLNTGAHPDDETSAMLAGLAYRDGLRIAYACANRGEGGQNEIGTERGADLGAVRTVEMERAADQLGMGLYWLSTSPEDPIFDFGFSKSGTETFGHWGQERTVAALVRIIRFERPDIVCPTFLDVPGQHGHHRAMTEATQDAVALAADPAAFPEQIGAGLTPWQVSKLYLPAWSGGGRSYDDTVPPPEPTIEVQSGDFDPILGATYSQIGEWSRAWHMTQAMGRWIPAGPQSWPLHRAFAAPGMPDSETKITDGLPTSLADLAGRADTVAMGRLLEAASGAIAAICTIWPDYDAIARTSAIAYNAVRTARRSLNRREAALFGHRLAAKEIQLARVAAIAGGLEVRLVPGCGLTSPGGTVAVTAQTAIDQGAIDGDASLEITAPERWRVERKGDGFEISLPEDTPPSDPYPQRYEPGGGTDAVCGRAGFAIDGTDIEVPVPLEIPIQVLPARSVRLEPGYAVVNLATAPKDAGFSIRLEDNAGQQTSCTVSLARAGGWTARFDGAPGAKVKIAGGATATGRLNTKTTPKPGLAELAVTLDGRPASTLYRGVHPHIGKVFRSAPAVLRVLTLRADLRSGLRIAYAGGGNDAVDDSLRALGGQVQTLGPDRLAQADLADFDTIVVGIFAFGTRADLAARRADLHQWVREGGNLVTLYHRPWDNWQPEATPPAHLEIGQPSLRWRVTDAAAKVKVLAPKHPLLTGPNKITAADWSGWVKERGLYFACGWDDAYEALIEIADPDEPPHKGALLSARIGKGRHTHVSLILHHQMDNLVPGAFRIMANLVSARGGAMQ